MENGVINTLDNEVLASLQAQGFTSDILKKLVGLSKDKQTMILEIINGQIAAKKEKAKGTEVILKLLNEDKTILITDCDGTKTLAKADDVFKWGIDSDFKWWGLDVPGNATPEINVSVFEIQKDATFKRMFGSLSEDFDSYCLTQHQIREFCLNKGSREWLRQDGYATLFPFKVNDERFVAYVDVDDVGTLRVIVRRFEYDRVWDAGRRDRVVVQQL